MDAHRQVVTFLMTDIVGSTSLWERFPRDMARASARHDIIASACIARHGGSLVKPRGEGDSLFAVFQDPADAICCACDLQSSMESEPWPEGCSIALRAAINTGTAVERDNDYYGVPVNLCARLRSAGHGGQVLVGSTTCDLARDELPEGFDLLDLGAHQLHGIAQPVHVYQARHPSLRPSFPPLRTPDRVPTNLPYPPNPMFVGRADLLDEIHAALTGEPPHNVALVGLTGLGKTQSAIEYGHRYLGDYPGGVFFVHAADTARLHLDCAAIGRFFDLPEHLATAERADRVRAELQRSTLPVLLIVDGLTDRTERVALPQGPQCRILVTCNQRHLVRAGFHIIEPAPLSESAALDLLQARRSASDPDSLRAAQETASALGYLPLALSLVANHIDRLGIGFIEYRSLLSDAPVHLLARARRRFISDTGHDGEIFDAIALRVDSLEPPAPAVLVSASLMAGPGISPAVLMEASGVCDQAALDEAVADLVDDSLLSREAGGRLSLHRLVRLTMHDLADPADVQATLRRAAIALEKRVREANDAMDWSASRPEIPHCLAVAEKCRRDMVDELFERLLFELGRHQFYHGEHGAAAALFDEAACVVETIRGPDDIARALAIRRRGEAKHRLGERQSALEDSLQALAMAESTLAPNDPLLADYHVTVGYVLRMSDRLDEAEPHYEQALGILEAAYGRHHPATTTCLNNLGALREAQGDLPAALALLQEALDVDTEMAGRRGPRVAIRLNNIGRVHGKMGKWPLALSCHEEALTVNEAAYGPSHPDIAGTHYHLGLARRGLGDRETASRHFARALAMGRRYYADDHPFCRMVRSAMAERPGTPRESTTTAIGSDKP